MAFLDFIKNRNAAPAERPTHVERPEINVPRVDSLPANVKAQAVEAARPAAEVMGKEAKAQDVPEPSKPQPTPAKGRSLGWER